MTTTTISQKDIIEIATKIAAAHRDADMAQGGRGEEGPVGYMTGACSVEDDIRAEWCGEDEATVEAALAVAADIRREIVRIY